MSTSTTNVVKEAREELSAARWLLAQTQEAARKGLTTAKAVERAQRELAEAESVWTRVAPLVA